LVTALVLTLALKLVVYQGQPVPADPETLSRAVSAFLLQHGFEPRLEKRFGIVFIEANAGKCRMLISQTAPQGWDRSGIELQAKAVGRLSYVFDGAVYANEPFLAPMIDDYWARVRFKMGLTSSRHPILAVAASDDCTINALPWWELSTRS
jgi:hypothetical protein